MDCYWNGEDRATNLFDTDLDSVPARICRPQRLLEMLCPKPGILNVVVANF